MTMPQAALSLVFFSGMNSEADWNELRPLSNKTLNSDRKGALGLVSENNRDNDKQWNGCEGKAPGEAGNYFG